ncbi:MAG: hypothetical protein PUC55_04965 [Lachnospiraceae bacterium]|nr:hypothetical protein [Lachnospiraceae bacterium]
MADGFFRTKSGFTVVQNPVVKDMNLSLKAKGLYLVIQSYITMPDKKWKKDEFRKYASEGKKAFDNAWNELKDNGYLKVHMFAKAKNWIVEYELLDEQQLGPHTYYYNSKGEVTKTNEDRVGKKASNDADADDSVSASQTQNTQVEEENQHIPPFGSNVKGTNDEGTYDECIYDERCYVDGSNDASYDDEGANNSNTLGLNTETKLFIKNENNTYSKASLNPINQEEKRIQIVDKRNHVSSMGMERTIDTSPRVQIDHEYYFLESEEDAIQKDIYWNTGLPLDIANRPDDVARYLMVLANWEANEHMDFNKKSIFILVLESLAEMILEKDEKIYADRRVNPEDVISQINHICEIDPRSNLIFFMDVVIDRYTNAIKEFEIKKPKKYIKSIIWNAFYTYQVDIASMAAKLPPC